MLREKIQHIKEKGIKVYLHHPLRFNENKLDILSTNKEIINYYDWSSKILAKLCREEKIKCVIHCHYNATESSFEVSKRTTHTMKEKVKKVLDYGRDVFLWEDTIEGIFAYSNPFLFEELIQPLNLDLNLDISHSYISLKGDNQKLLDVVKKTEPFVKYLHVVDSFGQKHDGLELGKGNIDWKPIIPYFEHKDFIFEILLEDNNNCLPMVRSAAYFNELKK